MKILYFADIRHRIGAASETRPLSPQVKTVADLVAELADSGDNYAAAFKDLAVVRVAVNCDFTDMNHPLTDSDEVAFFPPVTGG